MKNRINQLVKEDKVKVEDLIFELTPIFKDCFEGTVSADGRQILYSLYNGQKFLIKIQEI